MASALIDKSKAFALTIIKECNRVKAEEKETVLTNQLIRSGTSVGANIREAFFGQSKADFTYYLFTLHSYLSLKLVITYPFSPYL